MSDIAVQAAVLSLVLILPVAALLGRGVPLKTLATMALAWIAIFAIALFVVSRFDAQRMFRTRDGVVSGTPTRVTMASDGHFWIDASIDGVQRRMLIDTGATTTAISLRTARAAGLALDESPFAVSLQTANGPVVADRSTIRSLRIGSIHANDVPVIVSERFGETDVIGMNLLARLTGWRVEGRVMTLTP